MMALNVGTFKQRILLQYLVQNFHYYCWNLVIFSNSIGDITAVDIETGLYLATSNSK